MVIIPAFTFAHHVILNAHYVILNEVKNLSESANVRRLCYPVDASLSLSMTKYSEEIATSGRPSSQ